MEGRNNWEYECGFVLSTATNYHWKNPDGLTLKERYKQQNINEEQNINKTQKK
jgi:hypothetical protein